MNISLSTSALYALATGFALLTLDLWGKTRFRIDAENPGKSSQLRMLLSLLMLMAILAGLSVYFAHQAWTVCDTPCQNKSSMTKQVNSGNERPNLNTKEQTEVRIEQEQNVNGFFSNGLNTAIAALSLLVTMVTGISMSVAKNAVEDLRRVEQEIDKKINMNELLKAEIGLNALLHHQRITVAADMARYANMAETEGFNRMPALEQKNNLLTQLAYLSKPNFSAEKTLHYLGSFRAMLENNNQYKTRKNEFFSADDKEALQKTIEFLRAPSTNAMRSDYERTATALVQFIDVLERL